MAFHPDLEKLIGAPYRFENGPNRIGVIDPWEDGVNCQFLAHLALKLLKGVTLDPNLLSREIFFEQERFITFFNPVEATVGDIFIFGRIDERDHRHLHLAVCVDIDQPTGEPLLIHANGTEGKVCLWPLSAFFEYRRYQKLFSVKKLKKAL